MPENTRSIETHVIENHDNVRPAYSNLGVIQSSNMDFRLLFAELLPKGSGTTAELRASVVMAPIVAKAFAEKLLENIAKYEQVNGKIPWPPKAEKNVAAKSAQ